VLAAGLLFKTAGSFNGKENFFLIPSLVQNRVKMIREWVKIGSKTKILQKPKLCLPLLLPLPLTLSHIRFLVTTYLHLADDFLWFTIEDMKIAYRSKRNTFVQKRVKNRSKMP